MTWIALLYSVVLPERRLRMADLKALAEELGYDNVRTVASSGNLIFETAPRKAAEVEAELEAAFEKRFGKAVPVILRDAGHFRKIAKARPFRDVEDAKQISVRVMRAPYPDSLIEDLRSYMADERVALVDGDLFIHFLGQPSGTRLLAAFGTKRLAAPGTFRTLAMLRRIAGVLPAVPGHDGPDDRSPEQGAQGA